MRCSKKKCHQVKTTERRIKKLVLPSHKYSFILAHEAPFKFISFLFPDVECQRFIEQTLRMFESNNSKVQKLCSREKSSC